MSRTVARGLTALAVTALASFGLVGVANADTTCGYAGQPACLPATADKSAVPPGGTLKGTAGPVEPGETGPELLKLVSSTPSPSPTAIGRIPQGVHATGLVAAGPGFASASHLGVGRLAAAVTSLGTYKADSAGIIHYAVVIPKSTPGGRYTLNFPGHLPSGTAVTYFVTITVTGSGSGGGLPFTGAEIGIASALGVGLLGAGTLVVIATRRRRTAPAE